VPQILVVSHNIARGGTGSAKTLFARYARLERKLRRPIDVLCLQEQQTFDGKNLADEICRMLNGDYAVHVDSVPRTSSLPPFPDPAVIWNTRTLRRIATLLKPIPRLECYSRRAQMFATDEAQQRLVAGVRFRDASGSLLDVWSVHLDAWGGNAHKAQQLLSVVTPPESQYGIPPAPLPERKIICGDTNIYAPCHLPSRRLQRRALRQILDRAGIQDPGSQPTFFYQRLLGSDMQTRLLRMLGRMRMLVPSKFDVVATSMPVTAYGVAKASESDHNLVWAVIDVS